MGTTCRAICPPISVISSKNELANSASLKIISLRARSVQSPGNIFTEIRKMFCKFSMQWKYQLAVKQKETPINRQLSKYLGSWSREKKYSSPNHGKHVELKVEILIYIFKLRLRGKFDGSFSGKPTTTFELLNPYAFHKFFYFDEELRELGGATFVRMETPQKYTVTALVKLTDRWNSLCLI